MSTFYLAIMAIGWHLILADDTGAYGRSRYSFPDPAEDFDRCNRISKSYICDPDRLLTLLEAEELNTIAQRTVNHTKCPCSHYSCSMHPGGYKIGIALVKKIDPDKELIFDEDVSEKEKSSRRQSWLLNEAKEFSMHLLNKWKLGHCNETVILFYSLYDNVIHVATGDVARMKLNNTRISGILHSSHGNFKSSGNLFNGLKDITLDIQRVFLGTYQSTPLSRESRRRNAAISHHIGSPAGKWILSFISLFAVAVTNVLAAGN